ncbi:MAG: hypothetical protein IJ965_02430, partial [Campylobacter sp.]|nr:hypothetical protein [Campylobacter sp.]
FSRLQKRRPCGKMHPHFGRNEHCPKPPVDIYADESLGDNISLSVKFTFQDDTKTLEDEEIVAIMDEILTALKDNLGIGLR